MRQKRKRELEKEKRNRNIPHVRGEDGLVSPACWRFLGTSPRAWGRLGLHCQFTPVFGNIPTSVGKTLKMLNKIKYLTFSKVPNLLTFAYFQESTRSVRKVPYSFLSFIRLSKRFVPPNFCRLERPLYTTQKSYDEKQHHENWKYAKPNVQNVYIKSFVTYMGVCWNGDFSSWLYLSQAELDSLVIMWRSLLSLVEYRVFS